MSHWRKPYKHYRGSFFTSLTWYFLAFCAVIAGVIISIFWSMP